MVQLGIAGRARARIGVSARRTAETASRHRDVRSRFVLARFGVAVPWPGMGGERLRGGGNRRAARSIPHQRRQPKDGDARIVEWVHHHYVQTWRAPRLSTHLERRGTRRAQQGRCSGRPDEANDRTLPRAECRMLKPPTAAVSPARAGTTHRRPRRAAGSAHHFADGSTLPRPRVFIVTSSGAAHLRHTTRREPGSNVRAPAWTTTRPLKHGTWRQRGQL